MNISYSAKAIFSPLLLLALVGVSSNAFSDVYRWRDSKGVMQYSDVPPASITKNKKSEAILLKVIKNDNLCANPELTKNNKASNDPISLNILFRRATTSLNSRTSSGAYKPPVTTATTVSTSFKPISSTVSVANIGTTTGTTTGSTSGTTTGSTSGTTTGSTSGTTTGSTSGTTTGSTSGTTTGSTSGTTTGSTSGTTTGSTSGTTTGSTSGTTTGSTSGSASGTTTGSTTGTSTATTSGTPSTKPPKSAKLCSYQLQNCSIPTGMTAKVWYGTQSKWVSRENVSGTIPCDTKYMGDPQTGFSNVCLYVDNKLLEKVLDPKGINLMPAINTALVPKPSVGFSTPMIRSASIPRKDNVGAFRIACEYSHMSNDDPIVFPGVPNATHHHTFFGNTNANAYSTNETLRNSGNSTCAGGTLNRSGYWMPSLVNTSTGAPVKPSVVIVYYKGTDEKSNPYIKAPPKGLRMIAGNARPLAMADAEGGFGCMYGDEWWSDHITKPCGGNQVLRMMITFPQCWDGKNLDSPDHKSHMAFSCGNECEDGNGKIVNMPNSCPASHPVAIPHITINADFYNLDASAKYRLASDNYSSAYPGGYSLHADWMNGWDEPTLQRVVTNCLNNPKDCGGPNLGDGQMLYGVNTD